MDSHDNKGAVKAFAAAFAQALSESVGQAIGTPWPLEVIDTQQPPARKAQPVQFRLKVNGGLSGECFVEFYEPQVSELLSHLAGDDGEPAAGDRTQALTAVISSAAETLAASLAAQYGELSFAVDSVSGLAFGGMLVVPLAAPGENPSASVLLYVDGDLLRALSSASADAPAQSGKGSIHPANLKLVMDVELNVSLRFGQRQLPLRDVLELTSGSVVELDRLVDEPVELLLDGKLVARGEAVIVDGNYGLRVTEIPHAMETLLR
jgi:flagellar motor switch protein FliN